MIEVISQMTVVEVCTCLPFCLAAPTLRSLGVSETRERKAVRCAASGEAVTGAWAEP